LAGACGLGTVALLESDVSPPPLVPNNGELELKRVAPDPELLSRYAATDERRVWWENRVVDIWSDVFEHELNESGWLK